MALNAEATLLTHEIATWEGVTIEDHFDKRAFKRCQIIFCTIDKTEALWCVKLTSGDQDLFGLFDRTAVYAVPNKWGAKGWTYLEVKKIPKETLIAILLSAWALAERKN